jgi:hypothetical protein
MTNPAVMNMQQTTTVAGSDRITRTTTGPKGKDMIEITLVSANRGRVAKGHYQVLWRAYGFCPSDSALRLMVPVIHVCVCRRCGTGLPDGQVGASNHELCDHPDDVAGLPDGQVALVDAVLRSVKPGTKVVVVLFNGGGLAIEDLMANKGIHAVVEAFYPGARCSLCLHHCVEGVLLAPF